MSDDAMACVRMFGRFDVIGAAGRPVVFPTERSRHLLAILLLGAGAPMPRARLIADLWEDGAESQLRHNLNTEIWRLRRALANAGENAAAWITPVGADLAFSAAARINVDVHRFDAHLAAAAATTAPADRSEALAKAVELYAGELAPSIYSDWCVVAREAYRGRYVAALEKLLNLRRLTGNGSGAIAVAKRILVEDPFLEHVHREVMRCHAVMGDRAAALRHFERLRNDLKRDLGVAPTRETCALYELLREDGDIEEQAPSRERLLSEHHDQLAAIQHRLLQTAHELGALIGEGAAGG